MAYSVGFRSVKVIENATEGVLGAQGSYVLVEVTSEVDTKFYPNDFPEQGHPARYGIPIKAGQTRQIPMAVYNFRADHPVTVVAYGQ